MGRPKWARTMDNEVGIFEARPNKAQLKVLREWLDSMPIMADRKANFRSFGRDFSDGTIAARIIKFYLPRLIEVHNYPAAHSHHGKVSNWSVLNRKVLSRHLDLTLPSNVIEDLVSGKEETINGFLINLNKAIIKQLASDEKIILDEPYVQRAAQLIEIPNNEKVINNESNTSNAKYTQLDEKEDKEIIDEFKAMSNNEIIEEAEKLLKPFDGYPYCRIEPGTPLSELNLAFMENDAVRILMEKEAALATSLDVMRNLSQQLRILLNIQEKKSDILKKLRLDDIKAKLRHAE